MRVPVIVDVLGGSSNVLAVIVNVLGGSSNVLAVIVDVLRGSSTVLAVIVNVLGGSSTVLVHAELRRRHPGSQHAMGVHVGVAERQAPERLRQVGERQAGVDERAQRHVARDAREAIEIQDSRHYKLPRSLKLQYFPSPRIT